MESNHITLTILIPPSILIDRHVHLLDGLGTDHGDGVWIALTRDEQLKPLIGGWLLLNLGVSGRSVDHHHLLLRFGSRLCIWIGLRICLIEEL